jgi:hypothetical protein
MPSLDLEQLRADLAGTTDRMRRARANHSDAMAAAHNSLTQSRELLTEADALLAKGDNAFIEEYYRKG